MNNDLFKDKRIVVGGGIVVLIILLAGLYLLTSNKSSQIQNGQSLNQAPTEAPALSLNPEDIGLTLVEAANMQRATMTITKTSDIQSVDYQLSYNADVSGQSIPRGTIGHVDVKNPGQTISQQMVFGTCSDVCHYDNSITDVQLIVKVTKTDGKVYQVQLSVSPTPIQ